MLSLNDREWKAFKVKDIFLIEKCKCSSASTLKPGGFPYVGATNRNNGIMSFVEKKDKWITKGNCIVFICDGQGSVGYSIYKKEDFIGSTTLKVGRSEHLNRYTAQFLVSALDKNRPMYSYGYKRNENRLSNESIMLPTAKNGQPDYDFMEQYIREQEDKLKQKYIDLVNAEFGPLPTPLAEKEWKEFSIADIFIIKSGKRLTTADMDSGNLPFIGATELNNGVTNWINTPNETLDHNVLGVNYNGSVAEAFYHPYSCVFSDDVKRLHLKNVADGKYILLFLCMLIRKQKVKYTYGYKFNGNRMARQKILLPINYDGQPDYEYMKQYAKAVMFRKCNKYLEYQNCRIP